MRIFSVEYPGDESGPTLKLIPKSLGRNEEDDDDEEDVQRRQREAGRSLFSWRSLIGRESRRWLRQGQQARTGKEQTGGGAAIALL